MNSLLAEVGKPIRGERRPRSIIISRFCRVVLIAAFLAAADPVACSILDLEFESIVLEAQSNSWRETTVGDIDGDGDNEILISRRAGFLDIASVDIAGNLTVIETISLPGGRPSASQWVSPQINDIDNDGDMDVAAWWRRNNTRGVLDVAYQGPSGFSVVSYPTPDTDAGYRMAFGDFDGDGLKDAFTVNHGFGSPVRLFVLYNDPNPANRFVTYDEFSFAGQNESTAPFIADLDADGQLDVGVTTHDAGPFGLRLLFGDLQLVDLDPGDGTRSSSVAFGDVGADGVLDVVTNASVPSASRNFLWMYEQLAGRTFAPPEKLFASGQRPKMPMFGDFDSDGTDELVVSVTDDRTLNLFGRDASGNITGPPVVLADAAIDSVDHGAFTNPNTLTLGDVDNDGDLDILLGGDGLILIRNVSNLPPVAVCEEAIVTASPGTCAADASIDGGSFDPDGDPITLEQSPAGPYALGSTLVALLVQDDGGLESSCEANVVVEDLESPAVACNAPATITPPDAPIAFTGTASDNCSVGTVEITGFDCFKFTKKGKRIDKTGSCEVAITGDTVTILDSGGVGDHIEWYLNAQDSSGNPSALTCLVEVVNPGH